MTIRPTATGRRYVWTPATKTVDVYITGSSRTLRSKITGATLMVDLRDACLAIMDDIHGWPVALAEHKKLLAMLTVAHFRGPHSQIEITEAQIGMMRAGRYWTKPEEVTA